MAQIALPMTGIQLCTGENNLVACAAQAHILCTCEYSMCSIASKPTGYSRVTLSVGTSRYNSMTPNRTARCLAHGLFQCRGD